MNFSELAKARYSVRKFDSKPVEQEKLDMILEAGRVAPTAKNGQDFFIYVIKDAETREKMKEASPCTFDAPVIFVMCGDIKNGWQDPHTGKPRAEMDVSIVTTHMMLQAADIGLGTTWVCMIDPKKIIEILDLPEHLYPFCILPTGYPASDAEPSPRHTDRRPIEDSVRYI